jgi:hypothetical protein
MKYIFWYSNINIQNPHNIRAVKRPHYMYLTTIGSSLSWSEEDSDKLLRFYDEELATTSEEPSGDESEAKEQERRKRPYLRRLRLASRIGVTCVQLDYVIARRQSP